MRIALNLATRPFANLGPILTNLRIAMGALTLAAIGLGVGVHLLDQRAEQARQRERVVDTQITHITNERRGYYALMRQPENAAVLREAESLNKLIDAKSFSWTLAMEDLETVLPGGVQVTTLEPTRDEKDGHITLKMRVLGPRDRAIELVANLEHSKHFLSPRIVGESAETTSGTNQQLIPVSASNRVTFELLTDYNPPAPGDRKTVKLTAKEHESAGPQMRETTAMPPGTHRPPYTGDARPKAPQSRRGVHP